MSEVAIFSTSIDEPTYRPVAERLVARGFEPWVYRADKVALGSDTLQFSVGDDTDAGIAFVYNGVQRRLGNLGAAWYRHPNLFVLDLADKGRQLSLERELTALQDSFWELVPSGAWFNHPGKMRAAQAKLAQLATAQELGFTIPRTVVANRWSAIEEQLDEDTIIAKMSRGVMYSGNQTKVMYTTPLSRALRANLASNGNAPYPAIYQSRIEKAREWRTTVVGDDVFGATIYTHADAKDDWRKHQHTPKVRFEAAAMPDSTAKKCITFLKRFGLVYGAFDLIEKEDGELVFLECNTNGQFRWLEDKLGLPISDAITDKLVEKARLAHT